MMQDILTPIEMVLSCRLGRYEEAETRLSTALKLAKEGSDSTSPESITLSFVKALEVSSDCFTSSCADSCTAKLQIERSKAHISHHSVCQSDLFLLRRGADL